MYYNPCIRQMTDQMSSPYTSSMFPGTLMAPGLPTGIPAGPTFAPVPTPPSMQAVPTLPPTPQAGAVPQTVQDPFFTAGFLRSQIGKRMRVEFLIGTNGALVDRTGTLIGVGASYVLLRPDGTNITIMADLYSIKFVTIYPGNEPMI